MNDFTLPLSGLSPVSGKTVVAKFDGGLLSSNGGVLLLREIEQRLRVAERLADIMRFRLLMIGASYEDGNNASALRSDPIFVIAQGVAPSVRELASLDKLAATEGEEFMPMLVPQKWRSRVSLINSLLKSVTLV
ncbi:hypothetical protein A1351_21390 [Methylosinus sp. R-45379]|uniref:transposase n=1 Tax=Methylosinus sp. R-45379 TaxID=980563 RepID=UPI0007C94DC4|nr:hypothetical protein A1351_21390 [Methylosinus sp. R-45379]